MNTTTTTITGFALPHDHPAKPLEEVLRYLAPHIASSVFAIATRPPRPPLAIRVMRRVGSRVTRTGRALRAFASAYAEEPLDGIEAAMPPIAAPDLKRPTAGEAWSPKPPPAVHANGIGRAAEGGASS